MIPICRLLSIFCLIISCLETPICFAGSRAETDAAVVKIDVASGFSSKDSVHVLIKLREAARPNERTLSKTRIRDLQHRFGDTLDVEKRLGEFVLTHQMKTIPWLSARITRAVFAKMKSHPNVALVQEDIPIHASLSQSVPQVGADLAWAMGITGNGINVAVLDSGIDTDHPDLSDSLVWEECFLTDGGCPVSGTTRSSGAGSAEDGDGHGTHVSGIITSDNSIWRGVAPDAGIVAVKILDDFGGGYLSDLVAGLDWVADNHEAYQIRIVNMSLGSYVYAGVCDADYPSVADAADVLKGQGVVLFAASGNEGDHSGMDMPACLSAVVSVGAVYDADVGSVSYSSCYDPSTAMDQIACFSNVSTVLDLLAPGARIISSAIDGGTAGNSGTSMACPHAAGVAALLLESDSALTPDELLTRMTDAGVPIYDDRIGMWFPRIDAAAALTACDPDLDADGDVDGRDLALLAAKPARLALVDFASEFGLIR